MLQKTGKNKHKSQNVHFRIYLHQNYTVYKQFHIACNFTQTTVRNYYFDFYPNYFEISATISGELL